MDTLTKLSQVVRDKASQAREAAAQTASLAREAEARRQAAEAARRGRPATTGDIERLIYTVNNGWVGRGFAIGIGTMVLGFIAGLVFAMFWSAISS